MVNYDKIEMELSKISNDILKDCYNNIEEIKEYIHRLKRSC